jgi:hypothetical protein
MVLKETLVVWEREGYLDLVVLKDLKELSVSLDLKDHKVNRVFKVLKEKLDPKVQWENLTPALKITLFNVTP